MQRTEPPAEGMTVEQDGQEFARETLLERVKDVEEGQTVEVDWEAESGVTASYVGTVEKVYGVDGSIDMDIRTNGPTGSCYLHVNTETEDVFFSGDNRRGGRDTLLQFAPK